MTPLVSSSSRQLTGLTAALPARSRSFDVRGNVTVNEMLVDSSIVTSSQTLPYTTNKPLALSRYGVSLMEVSVPAVTNTVAYDSLGRAISNTDGRSNTRRTEYNVLGQHSASIDALGNRTTYAYDQFGNLAAVTNPLGHAIVYEYDLRGRKTYEGGATYPVRYTYDVFGNKTTMMTYRNESLGPDSGDVTTWLYDVASGSMTNKVYADGKGPSYSYTPDGKLSQRTWVRGVVTDYAYDSWNSLTNTVYSDNTPTVSLSYDAQGRQVEAHDAAGVTTFLYDAFGSLTNETVIGVAGTNTIERFWDDFGRNTGYALNGTRQSTLAYNSATDRIASMLATGSDTPFTWNYVDGSDLKLSLAYPNGLTASWAYDANNQLLQVCNATPTNIISQYDYVYDMAGRRIEVTKSGSAFAQDDTIFYGYNSRGELTNAVAAIDSDYRYAYHYDDIGNRESSSERGTNSIYTANNLNQYTAVDDFISQFDDDGNQTIVKTATGIWTVIYNGENRPVLWQRGNVSLVMSYDRLGRRIKLVKSEGMSIVSCQVFAYNGYLQIQRKTYRTSMAVLPLSTQFIWDPTATIATRPLIMRHNEATIYYAHDANKNVSVLFNTDGCKVAYYEYAPFGDATVSEGSFAIVNPWGFSCEYLDDTTGVSYYNFRHLDIESGRWMGRDPISEFGGVNIYNYCRNSRTLFYDIVGLDIWIEKTKAAAGYHERICVTKWKEVVDSDNEAGCCSNGKRYKKDGQFCIMFGSRDGWFSSSSSSKKGNSCANHAPSPYDGQLPNGYTESSSENGEIFDDNDRPSLGHVKDSTENICLDNKNKLECEFGELAAAFGCYEQDTPPTVNYEISTCEGEYCHCEFDMDIHNYFLGLIGKRMHYDAKNDNCRKFARNLDELIKNGMMIILNHWKEKINAA